MSVLFIPSSQVTRSIINPSETLLNKLQKQGVTLAQLEKYINEIFCKENKKNPKCNKNTKNLKKLKKLTEYLFLDIYNVTTSTGLKRF